MRLTTRISTAGDAGMSKIPVFSGNYEDLLDARGKLVEAKARSALGSVDMITWAQDDDVVVMAIALEYMRIQRQTLQEMAENFEDGETRPKGDGDHAMKTDPCERRMAKGRFAFVRIDISSLPAQNAYRMTLSYSNPRHVIGPTETFARHYALMGARILVYIAENFRCGAKMLLSEGENCQGIFKEAEWTNRQKLVVKEVRELNEMRKSCPKRKASLCSPSNPSCRCYRDGRCEEAVLDPRWEEFAG